MWPFNIFKKNEKPDKKHALIQSTLRKLGKINLRTKNGPEALYDLIRCFFREYFNLHFEFTYEELQKDLAKHHIEKNTKTRLFNHLEVLKEKRFGNDKISLKELKEISDEFREILKELSK